MFNQNRGYVGSQRSVRSMEAIENNEVSKSHITKELINRIIEKYSSEEQEKIKDFFQSISLDFFKEKVIQPSSWHHTGKFFNETNHYDLEEEINKILTFKASEKKELYISFDEFKKSKKESKQKIKYAYGVKAIWGGTRRHPRIIHYRLFTGYAIGGKVYYNKNKNFYKSYEFIQVFETWNEAKKEVNNYIKNIDRKENIENQAKKLKKDFVF